MASYTYIASPLPYGVSTKLQEMGGPRIKDQLRTAMAKEAKEQAFKDREQELNLRSKEQALAWAQQKQQQEAAGWGPPQAGGQAQGFQAQQGALETPEETRRKNLESELKSREEAAKMADERRAMQQAAAGAAWRGRDR